MTMTCFSSSRSVPVTSENPSSSKVVMIDGTLREFSQYTTAKNVTEELNASNCVIFDVNKLHVGEHILPLDHDSELYPGHTYMLLPQSASHRRLDSVDVEELSVKVKEAVLVASVEEKLDRSSSSFCGFKGMLPGGVIGEKGSCRKEKREGKKAGREPGKSESVWYLGFAVLPIEEDCY